MYIEESKGFGLGNFVSITPIIRELYDKHGKINVLFSKDYVKQCYINSPYINIIDKPVGGKLFSSSLINRGNDKTDIEHASLHILGHLPKYKTFVDEVEPIKGEYGVFINGAGNERTDYVDSKSIPFEYQEMIKENSKIEVIGIGSLNDKNRNIFNGSYGDIREALQYIKGAKWVISNVTGFYHVAGAYEKEQLCLWKDCLRPRNENLNPNCINSNKDNWSNDIIKFLK